MRESLLNQQQLEQRGWSRRMISQRLGTPDQVRPNPYHRSGPVKLFRKERVLEIERTEEFKRERQLSTVRSESVKDAVQRQRHELLEFVKNIRIVVPKFTPGKLADAARDYLDDLTVRGGRLDIDDDDPNFEDLLAVAFLCSASYPRYEFENRIRGKVGYPEAAIELHKRVYEAIAQAYPALSTECQQRLKATTLSPAGS